MTTSDAATMPNEAATQDEGHELRPFGGRNYSRNSDRAGRHEPCAYCGKAVTKPRWYVEVGGGGYFFFGPDTPDPEAERADAGYMGCYPVGRDCAELLRTAGVAVQDTKGSDGESADEVSR